MNNSGTDSSDNKGSNSKKIESKDAVPIVENVAEPSPMLYGSGLTVPPRADFKANTGAVAVSGGSGTNLDVDIPHVIKTPKDVSGVLIAPSGGDRSETLKPVERRANSPATNLETSQLKPVTEQPPGKPVEAGQKGVHPQPLESFSSNSRLAVQETSPAKVTTSSDIPSRGNQPAGAQIANSGEQIPGRNVPTEARLNEGGRTVTDATGVKTAGAQNLEQQVPQGKNVIANPADRPQPTGYVSPERKSDTPSVVQNAAPRVGETSASPVLSKGAVDSPIAKLPNPGMRQAEKPVAGEVASVLPGSQNKGEPARIDQPNVAPGKFDQPKGDVFSTQGSPLQTNRQDIFKGVDTKIEAGRLAEPAAVKDAAPVRDPKSAGVMNETFGQKTDAGSRVEPSTAQSAGNKQDAVNAGQKADQITKGIEGRVNEGAKQPNSTDGASAGVRQPGIESGGKSQSIADGAQAGVKQTGATDGAGITGKQPNVSDGASSSVRQPLHEGGDKAPSSGGGGSGTAESTRKVDAGMGAGGKGEGQSAAGGMGGGSSAPTDRAPHKPFSVEDAQPTKGTTADVRGDATGLRGGEAGGKAGDVVGGKGGDITGVKGPAAGGTGPRFDTGEVRGTEPGARFDAGELKDGRSAGTQSGGLKGGDGSAVKGSDAGIVKGADITGTKGAAGSGQGIGGSSGGSGSGSSGSSESGILGDKRQPSMLPDGMLNQGGKPGKVGDGISGGGGILGTDVPFVLPGALSGKEGGRRQADQIFTDKGKADVAPVGKQDAVAAAGKFDSSGQGGKSDSSGPAGRGEPVGPGGRGEQRGLSGKGDSGGPAGWGDPSGRGEPIGVAGKGDSSASGKGEQHKDFRDKGQKADVGIPAAMAGQIGAGAAEVGGALKNFAQSVLSDGKSAGQAGEGAQISKDLKDAFKAPAAMDGSGKETPNVRQDYSGPGRKTQILPNEIPPGTTGVGPGSVPADAAAKKSELGALGSALPGTGAEGIAAGGFADDAEGVVPLEEFNLPEVDLLSDADEVEEVKEIEEAVEAKIEDEMHYELALGLQLYTSIAGAQYGAYHYHTKDGDTVESVSRDIVGDVRCSPLVFSLNKEHIVASTEYGVHPFKVGVMVQLPTPRDLKEFFGEQA